MLFALAETLTFLREQEEGMATGKLASLMLSSTDPAHIAQAITNAIEQRKEGGERRDHVLVMCRGENLTGDPEAIAKALGDFQCIKERIPETVRPALKPRLIVINRALSGKEQMALRKTLKAARATTVILYAAHDPDWSPATDIMIRELVWPYQATMRRQAARSDAPDEAAV
ncbi:MAG: hypothetical protein Q7R83_01925 [bacterium]|nr:hypothetical protein [bacterium]